MPGRKKKPDRGKAKRRAKSVTHSISMAPEQRAELDEFVKALGFKISRSEVVALIAIEAMENPRPLTLAPRASGPSGLGQVPEDEVVGDSFGVSMAPATAKRIDETIVKTWGTEVSRATWYQAIIARAIKEKHVRIYPKVPGQVTQGNELPKRVGQATPKRKPTQGKKAGQNSTG